MARDSGFGYNCKKGGNFMAILEVRNVKKVYSQRLGNNHVTALSNVSFTVEKGEYSRGNKYSGKVAVFSERFQEKATEYYLFT